MTERSDGTLTLAGQPVHSRYVLASATSLLAGRVLGRDELIGNVLLETNGTLSIAYHVAGIYPNDTWSGRRVTYTRYHCSGGRVVATLGSDASLFHAPQTVTARSGSASSKVTFSPRSNVSLSVPLQPNVDGTCSAAFDVSHTAVPAFVEPGSFDKRVLGARFLGFRFTHP